MPILVIIFSVVLALLLAEFVRTSLRLLSELLPVFSRILSVLGIVEPLENVGQILANHLLAPIYETIVVLAEETEKLWQRI